MGQAQGKTACASFLIRVLGQNFEDFELVIVDDASTDDSVERCRRYADTRIRTLVNGTNRGVCFARNRGIDAALGPWVVFLDSDDELVPGALSRMHGLAQEAPGSIHALWFRSQLDTGVVIPAQMPAKTEWGYLEYIEFLEETAHQSRDMIRCVRRECFSRVRYPDSRMLETKFHLDFAREFRSRVFPDVLRLYHLDARDRLALKARRLDRLGRAALNPSQDDLNFVRDSAEGFEALLGQHGAALSRLAPTMFNDYLRRAAVTSIVAGRRAAARTHARLLLKMKPTSLKSWTILFASLAMADSETASSAGARA